MTDDHKDETSEPVDETTEGQDAVDETTEGSDATTAGPVAEDDSSSSQAAGDEPTSPPPADETSEEPLAEAPAAEEGEGSDAAAETAEEPGAVEEAPVEQPVAEEAPAEKKKDVIPGADLEPIAVEPEKQLSAEEKARLEAEEEEKARREAALVGDDSEAEAASREPAKMESGSRFLATGKRKCSIARVILLPGDGKIEINKRSIEEFFPRPLHQTMAVQPLTVSGYEGNVDVRVRVHGGGISGQAGAVRHGIARALTEIDPELRGELKRRGFLTRDARVKERRKAGFKKARKKPQFSKR
jgi:small subunit ribosomal protein S9